MDFDEDEFEAIWAEQNQEPAAVGITPEQKAYVPPIYVINNTVAKYKQLAQIMAVYFHAKHGEPMDDLFPLEKQQFTTIEFKLKE